MKKTILVSLVARSAVLFDTVVIAPLKVPQNLMCTVVVEDVCLTGIKALPPGKRKVTCNQVMK